MLSKLSFFRQVLTFILTPESKVSPMFFLVGFKEPYKVPKAFLGLSNRTDFVALHWTCKRKCQLYICPGCIAFFRPVLNARHVVFMLVPYSNNTKTTLVSQVLKATGSGQQLRRHVCLLDYWLRNLALQVIPNEGMGFLYTKLLPLRPKN